jgi:hypothetical protein
MAEKKPAPPPPKPAISQVEIILLGVVLLLLPFIGAFFSSSAGTELSEFFLVVLGYVKIGATIISMIALVIAVYSLIRIIELSNAETEKLGLALNWNSERTQKNERWVRVEGYMSSLNSSDWKIAILEADNILDDIVERIGYKGATLGERLKTIESSDFPYLDEVWQAHKFRNTLAHKGTDYALTRSEAEQMINIYHRVFKELGYL